MHRYVGRSIDLDLEL